MPLFNKALKFTPANLQSMTFDECYELLLCFRYLHFRRDSTISLEVMDSHMKAIENRMVELKRISDFPKI